MTRENKFTKGLYLIFVLAAFLLFFYTSSVHARTGPRTSATFPAANGSNPKTNPAIGTESVNTRKEKNNKTSQQGNWVVKKQAMTYRINGKRAKGLHKIRGKYYYFDKHGIQRTGWQKIKGKYYFFRIANGEKGRMIKSKKVNGIVLKKRGQAKLTPKSKAKLNVLIKANKIVQKATKPMMKRSEKRMKCFHYALKHFRYSGSLNFSKKGDWELHYALDMFDKGHGNCFAYGAAFAFLANAAGDKSCYAVSSGGHGWSEVNGKVYDLSWHMTDKKHNYYGMSYRLSGVGGRPNYKAGKSLMAKI